MADFTQEDIDRLKELSRQKTQAAVQQRPMRRQPIGDVPPTLDPREPGQMPKQLEQVLDFASPWARKAFSVVEPVAGPAIRTLAGAYEKASTGAVDLPGGGKLPYRQLMGPAQAVFDPDVLRTMDVGWRGLGAAGGTALAMTDPVAVKMMEKAYGPGQMPFQPPTAERIPGAAKAFVTGLTEETEGDVLTRIQNAIEAYQDEMKAGWGYWLASELATGAVASPALAAGGRAVKGLAKAPGLMETVQPFTRLAPKAVRPAIERSIRPGLRELGQLMEAPLQAETAIGRAMAAPFRGAATRLRGRPATETAQEVLPVTAEDIQMADELLGQPRTTTAPVTGARVASYWQDNPLAKARERGDVEEIANATEWIQENPTKMTARVSNASVRTSDVIDLPGQRGEEALTGTALTQATRKIDDLARSLRERGFDPDNPIAIDVEQDGRILIYEGNKRIRAAQLAGIENIPAEVRYYGGGEEIAGLWNPNRVMSDIPTPTTARATGEVAFGGPPERYSREWPFGTKTGEEPLQMGTTGQPLRGMREDAANVFNTREGLKAEISQRKKMIQDEKKNRRRAAGTGEKRSKLARYDAAIKGHQQEVVRLQSLLNALPAPEDISTPAELFGRDPLEESIEGIRNIPRKAERGIFEREYEKALRNALEQTGMTKDDFLDLQKKSPGADIMDVNRIAQEQTDINLRNIIDAGERRIAQEIAKREQRIRAAATNEPSPPNPPDKGGPPIGQGGKVDDAANNADEVFERIRRQRIKGEVPEATLMRRLDGAVSAAQNEIRIFVDAGNEILQAAGIGMARQGRIVARQQDIDRLDALFEALHNPSKVATGEVRIPAGLEKAYDDLRRATDWEEFMRLKTDPDMATVPDYFYRGWLPPEELAKASAAGPLGRKPSYQKPRVGASYREMRDAGFEPISWNPYEQLRIAKTQHLRHQQQMQLIDDLKAVELALPQADVFGVKGWRVPKVGPAFEGNAYKATNSLGEDVVGYTRRWAVPDKVANLLENMYGTWPSDKAILHVGSNEVNLLKVVDNAVFVPKRAKLFGSYFQQIDFMTRFYIGSWGGFVDALVQMPPQPITAIKHLARIPTSILKIAHANFSPGARMRIRKELNSTNPFFPDRPGVHPQGIMKAGLSTIDTTILPRNLDEMARVVADEAGLLGNKAVMRVIRSLESAMRRGLYEGTYPATQMAAIKNYIAPMIIRRYGKSYSDEALNGMIAHAANREFSTLPAVQSILGNQRPFIRETLRRVFFSIGESEGLIRQATGTVRGPAKRYWITHWVGAYLGLAALANGIHFGVTGQPLPLRRYSPVSKTGWGPNPVGYNPEFMAADIPIRETARAGRWGMGEGRRVLVDLVGQMDTVFRLLDPISFLSARESVPIRATLTQLGERDYFGRRIDQVGPNGIYSRLANLLNDLFSPIGPGQAAVQIGLQKGVLPEELLPESESRLGIPGQIVQATGLNLRAQQRWETKARKAVNEYSVDIGGEETTIEEISKHVLVRDSIKKSLPVHLRDKVDEYLDSSSFERRELEKSSDFRTIRDAFSDSYNSGGVAYRLRREFLNAAPIGWWYAAARVGISFPGSKRLRDAINAWIEEGNEFPDIDYKTFSGDFENLNRYLMRSR